MSNREGAMTRGVLWGVALALAVGAITLMFIPPPQPAAPPGIDKPVAVRAVVLSPRAMADVLRLTGRIRAWRDALLAIEQEGVITELNVDLGSHARSGDVLLRTDNRTWQAAMDQAAVTAADAADDLRRWTELRDVGAVAEAEFEAVRSRNARAEAALADARARLQQCEVVAPFEGVVDERWIERGEFIGRGKPALRLVDATRVKVRFAVPERDVLCVRTGEDVLFKVAARPEHVFTGTVSFVSLAADEASNTYAVELTAANADGRLRPGMIVEVALVRRALTNALVVPLAAVLPHKGEHIVYLAETSVADGALRAARRVVQIEMPQGHEVVLSRGVAAGDRVIVEGHRELRDGMLLDARDPAPSKVE